MAIVERLSDGGDYRYRLFGMRLVETIGRDLTGKTLGAWPDEEAVVLRRQTEQVLSSSLPLTIRVVLPVLRYPNSEEWQTVRFEQVLWPVSYRGNKPDAVLKLIERMDGPQDRVSSEDHVCVVP